MEEGSYPQIETSNKGDNGHRGMAAGKRLGCGESALVECVIFNLRGERMKIALGGTGDRLTPGVHRLKLKWTCMARPASLPTKREFTTDVCGSRGFMTSEVISFNLIPWIIAFDLIIIYNKQSRLK